MDSITGETGSVRKDSVYDWKKDKSFWSLLVANIISIIFLLANNSSVPTVLMVYAIQVCVICFFIFAKIICDKRTWLAMVFLLFFAPLCYACFYIIYGLSDLGYANKIDFFSVIISSLLFLSNHLYSFIYNYKLTSDLEGLDFFSFVSRILWMGWIMFPMIVIGPVSLIPFMIIKICLDLKYHVAYRIRVQNWGTFDS